MAAPETAPRENAGLSVQLSLSLKQGSHSPRHSMCPGDWVVPCSVRPQP